MDVNGVGMMCGFKALGFKNIYVVDKNLTNLKHAKNLIVMKFITSRILIN